MRDDQVDSVHSREWGRRLHDLFVQALQVPKESRREFLRGACDDEKLREEVVRLLAEDKAAKESDFLSLPKTHPLSSAHGTSGVEDPLVGQVVDDYRIEEWIASGGMGSVYRATRVNDFRHSVALKVARLGFGSAQASNRFQAERQFLAELNHPFIAQILDGGTTPQGQPYFVMEYINGRPIDRYSLEEDLTLDERVSLMVQVCRAVQHAHERGVIHRDVKPSNILVNEDGIPKLTDFGIARSVEDDSEQTQTGILLGTPSYTSPEQARGRRNEVGPFSDVFSLGAVLYRLLTGKVAFQGDSWKETIDGVCTSDPVQPCVHNPDVSLELQSICLKCLEKEPQRRYESARDLADDLQRWLDGRPVLARPIGRFRRWRRSVRRERWTGVVTLAALVAVIGVASWGAFRENANQVAQTNATMENSTTLSESASKELAHQTALLASQRGYTQRLEFNDQLNRIHEVCDSQPDLARQWLSDPVLCPSGLRGFAWGHLQQRTLRHVKRIETSYELSPLIGFSYDDQLTALSQRHLDIWDITKGVRVKQHPGPGTGGSF